MNKKIFGFLIAIMFLVFTTSLIEARNFDITDISYSYLSYNYPYYPNVPYYNTGVYSYGYYSAGYVNPYTGYITSPYTYYVTRPVVTRPVYTYTTYLPYRTISYSSPSAYITFSWQ